MNPLQLLKTYFPDERAFRIVFDHSRLVAEKAIAVAEGLEVPVDILFVEEAALLHDVGVSRVSAPKLHCFGDLPYICHGIAGRRILEEEGFPAHAMVCERHIGVGLMLQDIIRQELPLPHRDMTPVTREEKIICFADLFFSKNPRTLSRQKTCDEVRASLRTFGEGKVAVFDRWLEELGQQDTPG